MGVGAAWRRSEIRSKEAAMRRTTVTALSTGTALLTLGGVAVAQEFIPQPALTEHPRPACEGGYAAYFFYFDQFPCTSFLFRDDHCAMTADDAFQRNEYLGDHYAGLVEWTPLSITVELDINRACTEHTGEAFIYPTFTVDQAAELRFTTEDRSAGATAIGLRNMDLGSRIDPFISEPRYYVYRLVPGTVYRATMVCSSYPYAPTAPSPAGYARINATLVSTCLPDLDADGELTLFDFLAFQNAFDAGCP
jgi:hypothetical protein